jgi:hypothetical protein
MRISYSYYQDPKDPSKFSVADLNNNQWRGVITRTRYGKWQSESGRVFRTQTEAADQNALGSSPPSRPLFGSTKLSY